MKRSIAAGIVMLLAVTLLGCQTSKPGVKYMGGTVKAYVDASPEQTIRATEQMVEQMRLLHLSRRDGSESSEVQFRTAQDQRVNVRISRVGHNVSEVNIRVGYLGDETLSIRILEDIQSQLHQMAAASR